MCCHCKCDAAREAEREQADELTRELALVGAVCLAFVVIGLGAFYYISVWMGTA